MIKCSQVELKSGKDIIERNILSKEQSLNELIIPYIKISKKNFILKR